MTPATRLRTRIEVGLARHREQAPLARHPARQAFSQLQAHLAESIRLGIVGGAQHQFAILEQVQQAGVALHEFDHQVDHAVQGVRQAHLAHHEAADFLEETELLLDMLELRFQFFNPGHRFHYPRWPSERGSCSVSCVDRRWSFFCCRWFCVSRMTRSWRAVSKRASRRLCQISTTATGGWHIR